MKHQQDEFVHLCSPQAHFLNNISHTAGSTADGAGSTADGADGTGSTADGAGALSPIGSGGLSVFPLGFVATRVSFTWYKKGNCPSSPARSRCIVTTEEAHTREVERSTRFIGERHRCETQQGGGVSRSIKVVVGLQGIKDATKIFSEKFCSWKSYHLVMTL